MASCCINVGIVSGGVEYVLPAVSMYDAGVFVGYTVGQGEFSFQLQLIDANDGTWHFANIKTAEVYGLKECNDGWENIYKKYLIIKALECCPYDEYSLDDEKCLIGHLTDNCNC